MSKALIIAEKPSVANDLQRVLGGLPNVGKFKQQKDFFENDKFLISSAVGHLVQQQMPMTEDGKSLPWKFESLPVMPEPFTLEPIPGNKQRFNLLVRLMKRKDVTEIINACDAGREGELIFRYILKLSGITKPTRRMWMQSMTNNSIKEAFESLRTDEQMRPLADAALCRSESDWLIGINSSRAMTAFNSKFGGFNKTPVGRVQTPTLALMTEREIEIRDFVPRTYWEVLGEFSVTAGKYPGKWFREKFKKGDDKHARADRIWDKAEAEAIVSRCHGKTGTIEQTTKPSSQAPPLLYDLTSLQREVNGRFGFSARRTLQLAQRLYEGHKALTYPRTDSRYLPEDYIPTTIGTLKNLGAANGGALTNLPPFADKVVQNQWVKPNKRIFNSAKVSDHFAIIPTGQIPKGLDEAERKLYDMVTRRFIAVFYPPAEFEVTKRVTRIGEDTFRSDGKIMKVPGWLEVYGKSVAKPGAGDEDDVDENGKKKGGDKIIVPAENGDSANADKVESKENETKPPPRYNEGTLLGAMETAGKFVDDEELREAMSERGLGTPATRAATIEGLIEQKYIVREQRDFFVTTRGLRLIDQLDRMEIDILSSPEMTGEWEHKLKLMEQGQLGRPEFMAEIRGLTGKVVETARTYADNAINREWPRFEAPCPTCQAPSLSQDDGRWKCDNAECKFSLPKVVASRPLTEDEAREVLEKGRIGPLTGFVSRFRQPFDASIILEEDKKAGFKAGFEFEKSEAEEEEGEAVKNPDNKLCPCPLCGKGDIYVTPTSFLCDQRAEGGTKVCKARLSREMCKLEIPNDQAIKYFTEGKTDVIDKWISKKGRPFAAALTCNTKANAKGRMLGWEFPPREPKKKAAKKTAKKAAKKAAKKDATD